MGTKKKKVANKQLESVLFWVAFTSGLGAITEQNWKKFYAMAHVMEVAFGAGRLLNGKEHFVTPKEVHDSIGLIEISTDMTKARFQRVIVNRMIGEFMEDATRFEKNKK